MGNNFQLWLMGRKEGDDSGKRIAPQAMGQVIMVD